jgi:hypothetical protein
LDKEEAVKWDELDDETKNAFLMDDNVALFHWYINELETDISHYSEEMVNEYVKEISEGRFYYYGITNDWLIELLELDEYSIEGKTVVIMGSVRPQYEAIVLLYKGKPTTIEYNKRTTDHPDLKIMSVDEYDRNPIQFDCAISISSFEHDGLGRYGDPIDPDADLKIMQKMKKIVKRDGLLFLSVPIGRDHLHFNAHRIYGQLRFPKLIENWELLDSRGFENYNHHHTGRAVLQPVYVLRNL